jgi:hypothetical protein
MSRQPRLTSAEIGTLWTRYMYESMEWCMTRYFIEQTKDTETKKLLHSISESASSKSDAIDAIFQSEGIPRPIGFTHDDVYEKAPRLYSDEMVLKYIKGKTGLVMAANVAGLELSARDDVRNFYRESMGASLEMDELATQLLLAKGIYIRAPYIPIPEKAEFVENHGFMGNILGTPRTLHAVEITHLFTNIQNNLMGKALFTGFSQVANSPKIREYFYRGAEIANKHIQIFCSYLMEDGLPTPMSGDLDVTTSTSAPFSDRLMLFHATVLGATGFGNYAMSITASTRTDLVADYGRLMAEVTQYAEDGAAIVIENGWMEIPPRAAERRELALQS